jgi:hypothetical protein
VVGLFALDERRPRIGYWIIERSAGRATGRVSRIAAGRRVMFERYTIDPSEDVGRQVPSGPGGAGTIAT